MSCINDFGPLILAAATSLPVLVGIFGTWVTIWAKRARSTSSSKASSSGSTTSTSTSQKGKPGNSDAD